MFIGLFHISAKCRIVLNGDHSFLRLNFREIQLCDLPMNKYLDATLCGTGSIYTNMRSKGSYYLFLLIAKYYEKERRKLAQPCHCVSLRRLVRKALKL